MGKASKHGKDGKKAGSNSQKIKVWRLVCVSRLLFRKYHSCQQVLFVNERNASRKRKPLLLKERYEVASWDISADEA